MTQRNYALSFDESARRQPPALDETDTAIKLGSASPETSRRVSDDATHEEPTMIPDYLIIDEIRRRQQDQWQPEPLRLPLYVPHWPKEEEDEEEDESSSRVIIIDMHAGTEL